ncbi:MAG: DegT/DnrJ/EryC1/StrS family aminotransferase [Alistipes putredinis]
MKRQYEALKPQMDAAMIDVAASSAYIMGKPVTDLEEQLAGYVGVKHCVSCGNGTEALTIALKVLGIGKGDAVFVPDFTFFASAEVVALEGATPVFVDVEKSTFEMDDADLEKKVEAVKKEGRLNPKAVMPVDLFGLPANYPAIRKTADKYGLYVIEDGAQGFGGMIGGKRACGFGDISATSFFPAKPLGCYGDGGAVFTDNDGWADLAVSYRFHGKGSYKYDNVRIGINSRLDTIQAAILLVKFKAFREYELADVNKAATSYTARLKGIVETPSVPEGYLSSWAQYTIRLKDQATRDALKEKLKGKGIPSMVYYPKPMHEQTAFANTESGGYACANASELSGTVLSLPMHPYLTEEEIGAVCDAIKQ